MLVELNFPKLLKEHAKRTNQAFSFLVLICLLILTQMVIADVKNFAVCIAIDQVFYTTFRKV